jgi:hypothetical protein
MEILASAPQPAGYLTIIRHIDPSRRRHCVCGSRPNRSAKFKRSSWLLTVLVAVGWLLIVAGAAIAFVPDDAERVRAGYAKVTMMAAFMGGIGWLSARPTTR